MKKLHCYTMGKLRDEQRKMKKIFQIDYNGHRHQIRFASKIK